jgi:hypothetical protein
MVELIMAENKKEGMLSGGFLGKVLLITGIILIAGVLLGGIKLEIMDILSKGLALFVGLCLIVLVFKGVQALMPKNEFSPTQRWKDRLIRLGELSKPFNVKELYIRGEDMRVYSLWGKITGIVFIHYLAGEFKTDKNGNFVYAQKKDHAGNQIVNETTGKDEWDVEQKHINESDGEWCFVIARGFWIFATKELVRANIKYCSDIGEKVWIKTPNLVPIGDYFYPAQQWQMDICRIEKQHMAEAVIETHQKFLDLIATTTEAGLRANAEYRTMLEKNTETINPNNNILGGGKQ